MLSQIIMAALSIAAASLQPKNSACTLLTAADIAGLIGPNARTSPVGSNPGGGSCMFQNQDKIVTVLYVNRPATDDGTQLWTSKKRIAAAKDVAGWPAKAYEGAMGQTPVIGLMKGAAFVEVKLIDPSQKLPALAPKLRAAMQGLATRM